MLTVMAFKTPNHNRTAGITVVEVLITITLSAIILGMVLLTANPLEPQAKARDQKRLSDLANLERVINEYKLDNNSYPDDVDTLRTSTTLPAASVGPLEKILDGWITADFSPYATKLPLDPKNDAPYFYSYQHTSTGYELNTVLEYYSDLMLDDGGTDSAVYETGNNLTIL